MTYVFVSINRDNPRIRTCGITSGLAVRLRECVSVVLACEEPDIPQKPENMEIKFQDRDPRSEVGGDDYDLRITIFANDLPSRRANLAERCDRIRNEMANSYSPYEVRGYVRIVLSPMAFFTF